VKKLKSPYHHGDLRSALIDAALDIINEQGPQGLSIREAARRAGVSHSAPYRHFADRDALIVAVVERGFELMAETVAQHKAETSPDSTDQFVAAGMAYITFAFNHPAYYRVMFSGDLLVTSNSLQHTGGSIFETLAKDIAACQQLGIMRDGDPKIIAIALWSTLHGFVTLTNENRLSDLTNDGYSINVIQDQVLDLIFKGIGVTDSV
jgi:AcrR family transcriptional regulator